MIENKPAEPNQQAQNPAQKRPNELGALTVSGFVKIFDPKTQEVFVETRS
jgi:hypothetical protein